MKQLINFFFLFICHYFMYHKNNLYQKLAVNEILNNVSLSLSLSLSLLGNQQLHRVNFFFFFWLDALCVPMGEGRKTFYTKLEFSFNFFLYFILFYIISSKSIQSFSLNCLKDCRFRQQITIGSTVKGVTL